MKTILFFFLLSTSFAQTFSGDYYEDFRIKNPKSCPEEINLTYYSDKKLDLFIPLVDHGTSTSGEFINFKDDDFSEAVISLDNLYGAFAKLEIFKKEDKRGLLTGLKVKHVLRGLSDEGLVWQRIKGSKIRTCFYVSYKTPKNN